MNSGRPIMKGINIKHKNNKMADDDIVKMRGGLMQVKNIHDILYFLMEPDIKEILRSDRKNMERIEDILDTLLEVIENRDRGKDEFSSLVELINNLDKKAADNYLLMFQEMIERKTNRGIL
jgi:hypothetical protein